MFYSDSVPNITNSIGGSQPDDSYEKVIKGGSFNYPYQYLRPSRRSATYPTTLSSTAEYVGFRCARGIIPNPNYISSNKSIIKENPAMLLIDDLRDFTGSLQARLVFVNVSQEIRVLNYVNFAETHSFISSFPIKPMYIIPRFHLTANMSPTALVPKNLGVMLCCS